MRDKILEQIQKIQEKHKAMNEYLQQIDRQRSETVSEMLRLEGAFRELKLILDEKDKTEEH